MMWKKKLMRSGIGFSWMNTDAENVFHDHQMRERGNSNWISQQQNGGVTCCLYYTKKRHDWSLAYAIRIAVFGGRESIREKINLKKYFLVCDHLSQVGSIICIEQGHFRPYFFNLLPIEVWSS